jgi:hypothetical protein
MIGIIVSAAINVSGICFDEQLNAKPSRQMDFYLVQVTTPTESDVVTVYVGQNPDVQGEFQNYLDFEFRSHLKTVKLVNMGFGGLLGVPPIKRDASYRDARPYFHILAPAPVARSIADKISVCK